MNRRARALAGGGAVCVVLSVATGGLSTGYGMGVAAVLLRVGLAFLVFGVLTAVFGPVSVREAVAGALTAIAVVFLGGALVMYYDLGVNPPEYGTPLTRSLLVETQMELLLVCLPVTVSHLGGILLEKSRTGLAVGLLGISAVVGYYLGSGISLAGGSAPGFTQFFFAVSIVATSLVALATIGVMMRFDEVDH